MSLISIAQRETFYISFAQFANKGYGVDLLTPKSKEQQKAAASLVLLALQPFLLFQVNDAFSS